MTDDTGRSGLDLERALVQVMAERRISRRQLLERMSAVGISVALAPIVAACQAAATASSAPGSSNAAASAANSAAASEGPAPSAGASAAAASPAKPESELFIYNWDAYIGENTVRDFQRKYGIKVKYSKFPDAQTQITKIRSDSKGGGYDVTYPASTDVGPLARDGVIRELDLSLIPNIKNLGAQWQNPNYDPGNKHSVPNYWWTTGIAWDPAKVKEDVKSWAALWDPKYHGKLGMLDDVQETFAAAGFRLKLPPNTTNDGDLDAIMGLLESQKPLLRKYTSDDIGDFLSGQLWMTHAWSGDWVQMTYDNPNAKYVIPSEGAVRGNDVMVVTSGAQHPIAAHLWIDFNLDAKVSAANSNYIGYMGPNAAAQQYINKDLLGNPMLNPDKGLYDALVELVTLEGPDLEKYTRRWTQLKA
ncbi:MAG: PotD/PotF family extracellular solute-binding protein [Chloroflexota bacterium]